MNILLGRHYCCHVPFHTHVNFPPFRFPPFGLSYVGQNNPVGGDTVSRFVSPASKMALMSTIYNSVFKRTSTFFLTVMMGTFVFEKVFDEGMDNLYQTINQGVSVS